MKDTPDFSAASANRVALCRAVDAYIAHASPSRWSESWKWVEGAGEWVVEVRH